MMCFWEKPPVCESTIPSCIVLLNGLSASMGFLFCFSAFLSEKKLGIYYKKLLSLEIGKKKVRHVSLTSRLHSYFR